VVRVRRRVASVAVALLLVLSAVSGALGSASVAGTATAAQTDCSISDLVGLNGLDTASDCYALDKQISDNSTAVDYYQVQQNIKSQSDGYLTTQRNYGNGTDALIWTEAKYSVVNSLNDGNQISAVKTETNQTIEDLVTQRQRNLVSQYNAYIYQLEYIWTQDKNAVRVDAASSSTNGTIVGWFSYRRVKSRLEDEDRGAERIL
jgi:hypothetical protein